MDLILRLAFVAVIIIAAIFLGFLVLKNGGFGQSISAADAKSLVLHDLQNNYPGANISISNVSPSQYQGSWHIVASVVLNYTSPCPTYFVTSYEYPKYGFVSRAENNYTYGCVIDITPIKLTSYPVAITRSYDLHIGSIDSFVSKYGYNNVNVKAVYYNSTAIYGKTYDDVWIVNYSAPETNESVYAVLSFDGSEVLTYNMTH